MLVAPPANSIVPAPWIIQLGGIGVDIFFVISGFLITYISEPYFSGERSAPRFLAQRIIRVWPPYVVVTLLACATRFPYRGGAWPFDLQAYRLASMIFIPSFNEHGLLQPIVGPGWTLNYEMMFYLCFAVILCFGRSFAFFKLAGMILSLFLVGLLSPPGVVHAFLGSPIIFEFLIGSGIGFVLKAGWRSPSHGAAWIVAAIVLLAGMQLCGLGEGQRLLAYGLPAAALFTGFYALERTIRWPHAVTLLGDASYSIYLVHTLVIYRATRVGFFERRHFGALSTISASLAAIGVAIVAGLLFYRFVERPLLRACQKAYDRASGRRSIPPLVAQ